MKQITIDCLGIETPRQLHDLLAQALAFPAWYGCNLDALHDCLGGISGETCLTLQNFFLLPPFQRGFLRVFADAAAENPNLHIQFS